MPALLAFILLGFLGGLARALYGLLKAISRGDEVNTFHFLVTLIISAIIGGLLGSVFSIDARVAALSGYVGTDILETLFKASLGKTIVMKNE